MAQMGDAGKIYSWPVGCPIHWGQTRIMLPLRQGFCVLLIVVDVRLTVEVLIEEGRGMIQKVWSTRRSCKWMMSDKGVGDCRIRLES